MTKTNKPKPRYLTPCRCGTGNYCRRHLRYAIALIGRQRIEAPDPHLSDDEPCGGGRRVIRAVTRD